MISIVSILLYNCTVTEINCYKNNLNVAVYASSISVVNLKDYIKLLHI